jgi:hypothetical protein
LPNYLQLRVEIARVLPTIWRCFQIRSTCTFADLHEAIQAAGPWTGAHSYVFRPSRRGPVSVQSINDDPFEGAMVAEHTSLEAFFSNPVNKLCIYEYDLSAKWVHDVRLERRVVDRKRFLRRLVAGARAYPKDDLDGLREYRELVSLLKAGPAKTARERNRIAWSRGWDPEFFDLDVAKQAFDEP